MIIKPIDKQNWVFGANNGIKKGEVPIDEKYLPTTESQRFKSFDPWWCPNASLCNVLEYRFNWMIDKALLSADNIKWLYDNGYIDINGKVNFDDWFQARVSGTIPGKGNSFNGAADGARKYGLTPQTISPFNIDDYNNDKADFYQSIPNELYKLGEEFKDRFKINYEVVYDYDFDIALKYGPMQVGVSNWLKQGDYYVSNGGIIHVTMLFDDPWRAFDTYDPFIKSLHPNYDFFYYGYQWYVNEHKSLISILMDYFVRLKNGAIYWGKSGTNKLQKINSDNAGMAAITHLTRMKGQETYNVDDLDGYEVTDEFFGSSLLDKFKKLIN